MEDFDVRTKMVASGGNLCRWNARINSLMVWLRAREREYG